MVLHYPKVKFSENKNRKAEYYFLLASSFRAIASSIPIVPIAIGIGIGTRHTNPIFLLFFIGLKKKGKLQTTREIKKCFY